MTFFRKRQDTRISPDDIIITNIRNGGQGNVLFNMYIQSGSGSVIQGEAVLEAIEVSINTLKS